WSTTTKCTPRRLRRCGEIWGQILPAAWERKASDEGARDGVSRENALFGRRCGLAPPSFPTVGKRPCARPRSHNYQSAARIYCLRSATMHKGGPLVTPISGGPTNGRPYARPKR